MKLNSKFIYSLSLLTLLSYLIIGVVFYFFLPEHRHFSYFLIPAVLYIITILLHHKLVQTAERKPEKFVPVFLGITGIKLITYLTLVMAYVWVWTNHVVPFITIFFSIYIIFTVVEISALLKFLKQPK